MKNRLALMMAIAGAACGAASAQPFLINLSGATAQRNFWISQAVTNDFIDADGDGVTGEQLAPSNGGSFELLLPDFSNAEFNDHWALDYRSIGSGNGIEDLLAWGRRGIYAVQADGNLEEFNGVTLDSVEVSEAYFNRIRYINGATIISPGNLANPGAKPFRSLTDGSFSLTTSTGPGTGVHIDIATADVPFSWFVQNTSGMGAPVTQPGAPGYGTNPRTAVNKDGSVALNVLGDPQPNAVFNPDAFGLNTNIFTPDANTVFDFAVGVFPITAMVNFGVGLQQSTQSNLQHLFATGRTQSGENLMAVTRDIGSGTRNAFANGLCLDPSFCVGENIGAINASSASDQLGPNYQPTNKGGSSNVERTVVNTRLAIGHTSADRAVSGGGDSSFLITGIAEILAIQNDVYGGTVFARPTIDNVLDNGPNGYVVSGPASLSTVGDPRRNAAQFGGDGTADGVTVFGVENPHAAAWVNNITQSVAAFTSVPGGPDTAFSPGEFLAANNVIEAAVDTIRDPSNPCSLIPNPFLNQALQDFTRTLPGQAFANPVFASFNTTSFGVAPRRTTGIVFSDGNTGDFYVADDGTQIPYRSALTAANRIAGDFNFDGVRDLNDADAIAAAYNERQGGADWSPPAGGLFSFEINGDFQGDGNFDIADLRYWADGLAIDPVTGTLDRAAGFAALDNAWAALGNGNNLFGTALATPAAYEAGDSRADIAGNLTTRGFAPVGNDGVVDAQDIDYIFANFGDWSDLDQAINMDLSADMNGDLVVDIQDVCVVVRDILETEFGDANLDGFVDSTDIAIVTANQGLSPAGWADGDFNGDNVVDATDLAIANGTSDPCSTSAACSVADITADGACDPVAGGEGAVTLSDFSCYLSLWSAASPFADITADGSCVPGTGEGAVTLSDFSCYLSLWSGGCDGDPGTPVARN